MEVRESEKKVRTVGFTELVEDTDAAGCIASEAATKKALFTRESRFQDKL